MKQIAKVRKSLCAIANQLRKAGYFLADEKIAKTEKWLRDKNTIEFPGIWEEMYHADFNVAAYEEIMLEAGFRRR